MQIVEQLPPGIAGTIRTKRSIFLDNWVTYLPAVVGIIIALAAWDYAVLWSGMFLIVVTLFFHTCNRRLLPNLLLRRLARQKIGHRQDKIVDPDEPEARFVQVMPRAQWKNPTLRRATDVGFLKVDRKKGMLLFEGDRARYRIPAHSIFKCEQQCSRVYDEEVGFSGGLVRYWLRYYFVVVLMRSENHNIEAPFRLLTGKGLFTTKQQEAASTALQKEIQQLQGFSQVTQ